MNNQSGYTLTGTDTDYLWKLAKLLHVDTTAGTPGDWVRALHDSLAEREGIEVIFASEEVKGSLAYWRSIAEEGCEDCDDCDDDLIDDPFEDDCEDCSELGDQLDEAEDTIEKLEEDVKRYRDLLTQIQQLAGSSQNEPR